MRRASTLIMKIAGYCGLAAIGILLVGFTLLVVSFIIPGAELLLVSTGLLGLGTIMLMATAFIALASLILIAWPGDES